MQEKCPHCKANLLEMEIPAEYRDLYGGATHFSNAIAIIFNDRIDYWRCPYCKGEWGHSRAAPGDLGNCNVKNK